MTLATGAWGHDGVDFDGNDMRMLAEGLAGHNGSAATPGVLHGLKVAQQSSPTNTVKVAAGKALVAATGAGLDGQYHVWNDADLTSPTIAATTTNGRKDRLILRVTSGEPALEVVQGTPSASPTEPSITGDNYLELALITLPSSTSNITDAMITDRRVFIGKWAQPWGNLVVPRNVATPGVLGTSVTSEVVVPNMTTPTGLNVVANRCIKVTMSISAASGGTANTEALMNVRRGTTTGGTLVGGGHVLWSAITSKGFATIVVVDTPPATTGLRYCLTAQGGSAFDVRNPSHYSVEDVGPAANPD